MAQFLSIFRPKAAESRQNRRSVHPDVVFQVLQAAFVVVDQGVRIFPVREADQEPSRLRGNPRSRPGLPSRPLSAGYGSHTRPR